MKKSFVIAGKVVSSGLMGIVIFVAILYLYNALYPPDPHPDVVEGWAAGFTMIIAAALGMFISGALAMLLTFNDVRSFWYALAIPFFSGLITVSLPLLIVLVLGLYSPGLLILGLIVIAICLFIAELAGIIVYVILAIRKKLKRKTPEPQG